MSKKESHKLQEFREILGNIAILAEKASKIIEDSKDEFKNNPSVSILLYTDLKLMASKLKPLKKYATIKKVATKFIIIKRLKNECYNLCK